MMVAEQEALSAKQHARHLTYLAIGVVLVLIVQLFLLLGIG